MAMFIVIGVILISLILLLVEDWIVSECLAFRGYSTLKNPKMIYDGSQMNMFGCVVCWALWRLITLPYSICLFVYWIFHVGRKD